MRYILSLFSFIVLLGACTNLDEEVYDSIPSDNFPENEAQIALIPVGAYKSLQPFVDNGGWWFAQELTGDNVTAPTRGEHWDDGGKWRALHEHTWDNNTEAINNMWSTFYDGIFEANKAIDFLNTFQETEAINAIKAKLLALRTLYYWYLIDNFGDVPYLTTLVDAPELPMKEDREVIFQSITQDLEDAAGLIPTAGNNFAVTRGMAFTLLAKLYLNAEVYTGSPQWDKAAAYCDSVINIGRYNLESNPLSPFITNNDASIENIFTIPYDQDNFEGFNLHMRTLHYNSDQTFGMIAGPWNGFAVMEDHFDNYSDEDTRKNMFLVGQQYTVSGDELFDGTTGEPLIFTPEIPALNMQDAYTEIEKLMSGARVVKFEVANGANDNLSNDFPIFRYADVLLMRAEAAVRMGESGDQWVRMVRERAGVTLDQAADLDYILLERGRELIWEGHRRQDMIRNGVFNESWWEKEATGSERNLFPIPQWAIDANPNLGM